MSKPRLFRVKGQLVGGENNGVAGLKNYPIGSLLLFVEFVYDIPTYGDAVVGVRFLTNEGVLRVSYSRLRDEQIFYDWKEVLEEVTL